MINYRFLFREIIESRRQAGIFMLCVALSITTMVALNSFKRDVNRTIIGDARALHGGDVILHSHYEFSAGLLSAVGKLQGEISAKARTWEFYSVVRSSEKEVTRFCNILAVESAYPLYGEVVLQSGAALQERLVPGTAVVGRDLLDLLDLEVGDTLHVGREKLRITDVVLRESTRPVDVFNFGPRVFVAAADLAGLDLVKPGSRVEYELLIQLAGDSSLEDVETALDAVAVAGQERVSTYRNARSGLKRFFDNLLFFLSLISIFTLLLAGIGMQSSLQALLREKEKSLAITRALGATQRFLVLHYMLLVLGYGFIGSLLGIGVAFGIKFWLPVLFEGIIPAENVGGLGFADITEGMTLGFIVVCFFTFLPLYRLREVKPNTIFRSEISTSSRGIAFYVAACAGLLLFAALVIRQLDDVKTGMWFMGSSIGLILVISLLARLLLMALGKMQIRVLSIRQAMRSLLRPGNSTHSIIVTLASALSVLLAIFLVEYNLHKTYVESYPEDAPNLFLVDIQPKQREGFLELAGNDVQLHPIVRARLKAINDIPIRRGERRSRFSDSLSREFNLTYRDHLLEDEELAEGASLYRQDEQQGSISAQVSILDMVADMGDMEIGDVLHFNIQGVELSAEITSVRTRTKSMLYPFFYYVFPEEYLKKAPQTFFAAMHVDEDSIPELEKRIVSTFPNVSAINVARTAVELGAVMEKLSGIVNFFAIFSILAGALIIISSILATRMARIREAVYYKVLGSRSGFVFSVFVYENMTLGLLSSALGVALAQAGSWALCHYLFEVDYSPNWLASLVLTAMTLGLVVSVGMLSSTSIMRQKPIVFLREQTIE